MEWKTITKKEAEKKFKEYFKTNKNDIDEKFVELHDELCEAYKDAKYQADKKNRDSSNPKKGKYYLDVYFGAKLYEVLDKYGFTIYEACDEGIWRYLSLFVIPEVVKDRWDENIDRFYGKKIRIWLRFIWYCIYLAWDGSIEKTVTVLEPLNTDVVVQFIERNNGGQGYRRELSREIFKYFKRIHYNEIAEFNKIKKYININRDLSRDVAKLNKFRCVIVEPALYKGGVKGYVDDLFATVRRKYES